MPQVFADSGYWVALIQPGDQLSDQAETVAMGLSGHELVTTQMVLVEVLTHVARRGTHLRKQATTLVRELETDPLVEIVPQTDEQFQAAVRLYERRKDKTWSLTDCSSFLAMKERGIFKALAHDDDFRQAGFEPLLRQDPD